MKFEQLGNIKLYNADCMEVMKTFKDKQFDLAIVDPPYGIGNFSPTGGSVGTSCKGNEWNIKWNNSIPEKMYFQELLRISTNQIIWGANYYNCFTKKGGAVVWDKGEANPIFSRCEIASLSFQKRVDYIFINWQSGFYRKRIEKVIHPCQKPVALYKWLLHNYAKEGDKILDTHFGSLSIGIACNDMGFELTAIELDKNYYEAGKKRLIEHQRQLTIF